MRRTLSIFILLLFLMTGCGIKAREFNVREMMPSFYDSEWLVNTPESYIDSSVMYKYSPSRYLSGYYSSVLLTQNSIGPSDSLLSITGHLRIDSLAGNVDIAVRCWDGSSRKRINHIGEFHEIISSAKPQEWQKFRLDIPVCHQMKEYDFEITIRGAGILWIG